MEREISLERLATKARQLEGALRRVERVSQKLGGPEGPGRLRWDIMQGAEKISRIIRVGEVRNAIKERTNPALAAHLERIRQEIDTRTAQAQVIANLAKIEQMVQGGNLTEQEAEAAREEGRKILGAVFVRPAPSPAADVQAEQPALPWQEQELTPLQRRAFDIIRKHSIENAISTREWLKALYPTRDVSGMRRRVSVIIIEIRPKLQKHGLDIRNLRPGGRKGFRNIEGLYYLASLTEPERVPPAAANEEKGEKKKKEAETLTRRLPQIVVFEPKLVALNAILDNPNITINKVIQILGPSHKTSRMLTVQQVFWALRVRGEQGFYMRGSGPALPMNKSRLCG